jgi:hypothetical protein
LEWISLFREKRSMAYPQDSPVDKHDHLQSLSSFHLNINDLQRSVILSQTGMCFAIPQISFKEFFQPIPKSERPASRVESGSV